MASFTGNISEWEWTRGNSTDTYSLEYDALSRIVDSRLFRNGNPVDALSESGISYDSNGNILSLTRTGEDGSAVNDLSYHYDGNRLTSFSDGVFQSQNYTYDADGNMTFDGRTGMSLTWNDLGLVEKVSLNDTDLVNYSYLADGTKVSAMDGDGDGLLYLGSLIYRKTGSNISLESAGFAGGRFVARETSPGVSAMAAGGVVVMNSSKNKNDGYERGKNTSTDNSSKKKSGSQLQRDISKGRAPKSFKGIHKGKFKGEQTHVHFDDGSALNYDGTWKHGGRELTKAEQEFLNNYDWNLNK